MALPFLQTARQQLDSVMPKLDRIALLQDELRECVSPADIKTDQQKLWLLRQQHSELDHRLALKCRQLEGDLEMLPVFRERYDRFMGWADDLERRLDAMQKSAKVSDSANAAASNVNRQPFIFLDFYHFEYVYRQCTYSLTHSMSPIPIPICECVYDCPAPLLAEPYKRFRCSLIND